MSQPTSALLRLPAELRHETYSYILPDGIHVRLVRGEIYFSPCLERSHPRPSPHIDGQERRSDKDDVSRWARRLDSSWGPHWMCEEHAMTILNKFDLTLALVCKSMYAEVIDLVTRTAIIHITDLDTLDSLGQGSMTTISAHPSFFAATLSTMTQLIVTLRLPLRFFKALEREPQDAAITPGADPQPLDVNPWLRLGPTLDRLQNLTNLRMWLDYDEAGYWSVVNERALLDPLLIYMYENGRQLDVSIVLPKLHPKFEDEARHYVSAELPGRAQLCRVLRQRWWHDKDSRYKVIEKRDFPFSDALYELVDRPWDEHLEGQERADWKRGVDVERQVADDINDLMPNHWGSRSTDMNI